MSIDRDHDRIFRDVHTFEPIKENLPLWSTLT